MRHADIRRAEQGAGKMPDPKILIDALRCIRIATLIALSLPASAASAELTAAGDEIQINTFTTDDQGTPAVARLTDGGFVVVWQSFDQVGDNDFDVFAQRFDGDGVAVGTELQVNSYTTDDQTAAQVVGADDGGFVVVWQSRGQSGGTDYDVFVRRFNASAVGSGLDTRVNVTTADDQARPVVTKAASGIFVVAWQSFDQSGTFDYDIVVRSVSSAGTPTGAEIDVDDTATDEQTAPSVAAAADGTFVVAWQDYDAQTGDDEVSTRAFSAAGAPLDAVARVNTSTDGFQTEPRVAASPDGSFVVAWQTYDGNGLDAGIAARRIDADAQPIGAEISVNETTDGDQVTPAVAVDEASGRFVVAWAGDGQDEAGGYAVVARAFDSTGTPMGGDALVNQTTTDDQERPSISTLGSGRLAVAWQSFGQEGPLDAGVVGRLLDLGGGACGDYTGNGTITAADALGALQAAVGLLSCQLCICDVDQVNGVKATDALLVLNFAVGLPAPLNCAPC